MTSYNLDFFQAMEAWESGSAIECSNGEICAGYQADSYDRNKTFPLWIIQSKWRIVEQEKCWLDKYYPTTRKDDYRYAIKDFVREAIKRIEDSDTMGYSSQIDAVNTLKEMIGEK